jgi:hypothetical protein
VIACADRSSALVLRWSFRAESCDFHHRQLAQPTAQHIANHTKIRIAMASIAMASGSPKTVHRSVNKRTQGCGLKAQSDLGFAGVCARGGAT